jgi:ribonucleoside-diphosphate reductase alpha chain
MRHRLPNRRGHELVDFEHCGIRYTAGIGRFSDGRLAEIFLITAKHGTAVDTNSRDAAVAASLLLQHGRPIETLRRALRACPRFIRPSMTRNRLTEEAIQRTVFAHLRVRAAPGVVAFHVPNGGYRRPTEAARLKGLGVRPGVPDLVAVHRGQVYALELKREGGRATDAQLQAIKDIRSAGGHAEVCYGLDCALAALERWGLVRGRADVLTADMENHQC